ncbi:MAG: thermonuclease family protein [Pseudomonadota bacterium]
MRRKTRSLLRDALTTVLFLSTIAATAAYLSRFAVDEFDGSAFVIDGDSIRVDGREVRLKGIDAPERGQNCTNAGGALFDCGAKARAELQRLIGDRSVKCDSLELDRFGRALSTCTAGSDAVSLNEQMVMSGWVVDFGGYPGVESNAREERVGLWAGEFSMPRDFRARQAQEGSASWLDALFGRLNGSEE